NQHQKQLDAESAMYGFHDAPGPRGSGRQGAEIGAIQANVDVRGSIKEAAAKEVIMHIDQKRA
ncbi:MAG: hypothetical protein ACRCZ5_12070, partial [Burkholderiales bacterium]